MELLVIWGAEVVGPSLDWNEPVEIFDVRKACSSDSLGGVTGTYCGMSACKQVALRDPVTAASRAGHAHVVRKLLQLAPNAPFPRYCATSRARYTSQSRSVWGTVAFMAHA